MQGCLWWRVFISTNIWYGSQRRHSIKLFFFIFEKFLVFSIVAEKFMQVWWTFIINGLKNIIGFNHIRLILYLCKFILHKTSYILTYFFIWVVEYFLDCTNNSARSSLMIQIKHLINFNKIFKEIFSCILILDCLPLIQFQILNIGKVIFVINFHKLKGAFFNMLMIVDVNISKNLKNYVQ